MIATFPAATPRLQRSGQALAFLAGCALGVALFWHHTLDRRPDPGGIASIAVAQASVARVSESAPPLPFDPAPAAPAPVETALLTPAPSSLALPPTGVAEQIVLEIVYDLNSSFLPAAAAQDLERLLAGLRPDRRYAIELAAAVNEEGVRGAKAADARRYNRWLAERRLERLTGWLKREPVLSSTVRGRLVEGDATRRVMVDVRELP